MIGYPRPSELTLEVVRVEVPGTCPECNAANLAAYPVLSETGWYDVIKCQDCLFSVERTPGPRLGPVELLSETL